MGFEIPESEKTITYHFICIEESLTYLGVLKNLPLMEATQVFESKLDKIIEIGLSAMTGDNREFPAREELFSRLDEDLAEIENLLHANEALDPIYDGMKLIFKEMEQLHDSGMSLEEGRKKLRQLFENRSNLGSS
jgi:hypothetical protein